MLERPSSRRIHRSLGVTTLVVVALISPSSASAQSRPIAYNRDIRPLLADNCFACHGPDKNNRKGKLRLDDREAAIARDAIVPGHPDKSELVARIFSDEPTELMPPKNSHKKLKPAEKELLRRWIAEGANYEPYWAYVAPQRPNVPNNAGVASPIDAFIRSRLAEKKIQKSPEADRRTLLRRLSLDLIGLPPSPEEVEAFVADTDPRAYEKQVDRLLASRHFGERWAAPWLDVVRFADTVGFHGDQIQRIFPYRDYVIDSFNANKPFDQFTIEQIAGDLLPNPTTEQLIATGFNRLNMMTREGGAQPKEYLVRYSGDRVRTIGTAWLGATLGCCECHDHKYDPFTTKDFYQMSAFFADIKQWGVYSDYSYTPNPDLKGWTNEYPFPPEIQVESPALLRRLDRIRDQMMALFARDAMPTTDVEKKAWARWQETTRTFLGEHPDGWQRLKPVGPATIDDDGKVLLPAKGAGNPPFQATLPTGWLSMIKVELYPHAQMNGSILRGKLAPITLTATVTRKGGNAQTLTYRWAEADEKAPTYSSGEEVLGILKTGWKLPGKKLNEPRRAEWCLTTPVAVAAGDVLSVTINGPAADHVRVSCSPLTTPTPFADEWAGALRACLLDEAPNEFQRTFSAGAYLMSTAWKPTAFQGFRVLEQRAQECRGGKAWTMVTEAVARPMTVRVLPRGNWQDESGEVVAPNVPHFLPPLKVADKRRPTRLDLAKWLVSPENPLTARVVMNRLWKEMFGQGISARLDDLGGMGEWPTHPELLDWLAVEFREKGWNFKHMVKQIAMSETYRQSSDVRSDLRDIDPNNRLLAGQNPRRLEAEFVRDNILAIAGLLNRESGGPSAWPEQPAHYYVNLQFPNRTYVADPDDRRHRRGVYMHWQRTFLHPMLANFDAPSREDCIAARVVANTPQQALTLLNDPSFVEAARVFAGRLLTAKQTDDERIALAFQTALSRDATADELRAMKSFLASQRDHFRDRPADAGKLIQIGIAPNPPGLDPIEHAVWTNVCRTALNLHETITRY